MTNQCHYIIFVSLDHYRRLSVVTPPPPQEYTLILVIHYKQVYAVYYLKQLIDAIIARENGKFLNWIVVK